MPDTIAFSTFLAVTIGEFCVLCLVLMVFLERSIRRAFRHLEETSALREDIESLEAIIRDYRDNWDHDEDAHTHGTPCRVCVATKVLGERALKLSSSSEQIDEQE